MSPMEFNQCKTCGANNGRAGTLIDGECLNCHDTRETGAGCVHENLQRTPEELKKTFAIIKTESAKDPSSDMKKQVKCLGKVRVLEPGKGKEDFITVSLFPEDGIEVIGEARKSDLPQELHKVGAVFTYTASDKYTYRFEPVTVKELTEADIARLQENAERIAALTEE